MSVNAGIYATLKNGTENTGNSGWWGTEEHITKAGPVDPADRGNPYHTSFAKDGNGDWIVTLHLKLTVYWSWMGFFPTSGTSVREASIQITFPGDMQTDENAAHAIEYYNAQTGQYEVGGPPLLDNRFNDLSKGVVSDPQYYDQSGRPILTLSGGSSSFSDLLPLLQLPSSGPLDPSSRTDPYSSWYNYEVSQLNGDTRISLNPNTSYNDIETGSGGTVTIEGGSNSTLYLWKPKNVVWNSSGVNNTILMQPIMGSVVQAPSELVLNLVSGVGNNPYGGTLNVQRVDNVTAQASGEYIICNDDGDTINGSFYHATGNALIVGGSGNDSLSGSDNFSISAAVTSMIVAGLGKNTLTGGINYYTGTTTNVFTYNGGTDTITNFRAGAGSGDMIDLSALGNIHSYADLQSLITQSGADTILNFGSGATVTLRNVSQQNLAAGNFLFRPIAGFIRTQHGEADAGQTVQLGLAISGAVSVDTSGGSPTLSLSDGAVATYDAAASNPSGHNLVFNYTIGSNDHSTGLAIQNVNLNGATIRDGNGDSVDFSRVLNQPTSLQINHTPLTVSSVASSRTGEVDAGQQVQLTLTLSEPFTYTFQSSPRITLNDGATVIGQFSGNTLVFNYLVGPSDQASNLQITNINLGGTVVHDANGFTPDFSAAVNVNTGVQVGPSLYVTSIGSSSSGEVDAGQIIHLNLTMSEGLSLSGGPPTLTLSNGATATYDGVLSNLAQGTLVFDYTVGTNDRSPNLGISAVNLNAASIHDAAGHAADFSGALNKLTSVQVGPSPLAVTSVSASPSGQVTTNANVLITVQMNEAVHDASGDLTLNDGGIAFFDSTDSNLATGKLVFDYVVDNSEDVYTNDRTPNLTITGVTAVAHDANGYSANFAGASNTSLGVQVGPPLYLTSITTASQALEADAGQTVRIFLNMSAPVTVNTSSGSPRLALNDGGVANYNAMASNLAAGQLAFDYTVGAADRAAFLSVSRISLNGAIVQDGSGHNADFTLAIGQDVGVVSGSSVQQLQIGPNTVVAIASSQLGRVNAGQTIQLEIDLNAGVAVNTSGGIPTVTLNNGAVATYDSVHSVQSAGALIFDYTIGSEHTTDLKIAGVRLNGATVKGFSGSDVDFSQALTRFNVSVNAPLIARSSSPDFNGNGTSDMLWQYKASGGVYDFQMSNGQVTSSALVTTLPSSSWAFLGTGDFNGDGTSDFLEQYNATGGIYDFQMSNGQVTSSALVTTLPSSSWTFLGTGDFNSDGTSDSLFQYNTTGGVYDFAMNNGQLTSSAQVTTLPSSSWTFLGTGDFNGDGTSDQLWQYKATGGVYDFTMSNGQVTASPLVTTLPSSSWSYLGSGDFNGDGTSDMLWQYQPTGGIYDFQMSNGQVASSPLVTTLPANVWTFLGTGDFNGDGTSDFLMQYNATGGVYDFGMSNGQLTSSPLVTTLPASSWSHLA